MKQYDDEIEILFECDNKEISVGAKRQKLLERATGEYIVFIDDDDWVADFYVSEILKAIKYTPDCIGFLIDCDIEGVKSNAKASLRYKEWQENVDGFKYVRSIYHKTPVKREIALQVGFSDKRFGEDYEYSQRIMPLLKTEVFINKVMYYYIYRSKNQTANERYGIKS